MLSPSSKSRMVPGAPPSNNVSKPKKKKAAKPASEPVKVQDAALIEQSPADPTQVAPELKVTGADLAQQAEKQSAIAAVQAIETTTNGLEKSRTQQLIGKKLINYTKKLQKIRSYETQDRSKLNEDQIRSLASKNTVETVYNELKSLSEAVAGFEQEEHQAAASKLNDEVEKARKQSEADSKAKLVLLLQFMHLFNLFFPNPAKPPSFAPNQDIPPALQASTGQEVAALGKLFDQLANGPLQGGHGDVLEILANIESSSTDEVLPDVSFSTVRSMILKLTAPPAEPDFVASEAGIDKPTSMMHAPAEASKEAAELESSGESLTAPTEAPLLSPNVQFMQASELGIEPEGGAFDAAPTPDEGATKAGEDGGKGVVMGFEEPTSTKADGTAAAAVEEPINMQQVIKEPGNEVMVTETTTINWADDEGGDDIGEAPVFQPISSNATGANTPVGTTTPAPAAEPAPQPAASTKERKPKNGQSNGKSGGKNSSQLAPPRPSRPQPIVDEDGFILQESRRSRMLAERQQQQATRGRGNGRGGRGGARGGRGGSARPSGSAPADGAGKVRAAAARRGRAAAAAGSNPAPAA